MLDKELIIPILVGVFLFVTDLAFGWMTIPLSPFPVLFIIAFVTGFLARGFVKGVQLTFFALLIGILVGCLLGPVIFSEFWEDDVFLPLLPLVVMMWSVRGMFLQVEPGETWGEQLAQAIGMGILLLVGTPIIYLFSLAVGGIGGLFGKVIIGQFAKRTRPIPDEIPDHWVDPDSTAG
ncbi:MAG: hypothetical protein ACFE7R_02890 [Candidatus Hodarchaeota archaeon]